MIISEISIKKLYKKYKMTRAGQPDTFCYFIGSEDSGYEVGIPIRAGNYEKFLEQYGGKLIKEIIEIPGNSIPLLILGN